MELCFISLKKTASTPPELCVEDARKRERTREATLGLDRRADVSAASDRRLILTQLFSMVTSFNYFRNSCFTGSSHLRSSQLGKTRMI
ncbi:hypothetical protein Nepgr_000658 [Nepenthes gracilis]|uniref:Uncharacterized protein n=1 Tax=Nepenthes gracilis TaxID=150966 RepID=A0AAD3RWD4_NEPGR|nr:hypothetical protein Nepgr_000658 [Nepenthes gracilis]